MDSVLLPVNQSNQGGGIHPEEGSDPVPLSPRSEYPLGREQEQLLREEGEQEENEKSGQEEEETTLWQQE